MLFGKKQPDTKTVLLLDIESGSAGSALAHTSLTEAPKLFGESRVAVPFMPTRNTEVLLRNIERAARETLMNTSSVAARLRGYERTIPMGTIESVAVFMHAPWGTPNLATGNPDFAPGVRKALAGEIAHVTQAPVTFYTGISPTVYGLSTLYPKVGGVLLGSVGAEVTELLLLGDNEALGYAGLPTGSHSLLRTLTTHAGVSTHEAYSILQMYPQVEHAREPLQAVQQHFVEHFVQGAQELLTQAPAYSVVITAQEPFGEYFARALTEDASLQHLFPEGGVVRPLKAAHVRPLLATHAHEPDLSLMLQALFVHAI